MRTARAGVQEATPGRHGVRCPALTPDLSVEPFAPAIRGPREPRPARAWQMGPAEMELDDPQAEAEAERILLATTTDEDLLARI